MTGDQSDPSGSDSTDIARQSADTTELAASRQRTVRIVIAAGTTAATAALAAGLAIVRRHRRNN